MTPDRLIKKYKEEIGDNLSPGEKEVLDAYINLRVTELTQNTVRQSIFWDWASTILFTTGCALVVVCVIGGFIYLVDADQARAEARAEFKNHLEQSRVMLQACEEENQKVRDVCITGLIESCGD